MPLKEYDPEEIEEVKHVSAAAWATAVRAAHDAGHALSNASEPKLRTVSVMVEGGHHPVIHTLAFVTLLGWVGDATISFDQVHAWALSDFADVSKLFASVA